MELHGLALRVRRVPAPDADALEVALMTVPLPWLRPDAIVVGPDFHIKPLLAFDRCFNILALSKQDVRLLRATSFDWTDARSAVNADTVDGARNALMVADPRRVATVVKGALGDDPARGFGSRRTESAFQQKPQ